MAEASSPRSARRRTLTSKGHSFNLDLKSKVFRDSLAKLHRYHRATKHKLDTGMNDSKVFSDMLSNYQGLLQEAHSCVAEVRDLDPDFIFDESVDELLGQVNETMTYLRHMNKLDVIPGTVLPLSQPESVIEQDSISNDGESDLQSQTLYKHKTINTNLNLEFPTGGSAFSSHPPRPRSGSLPDFTLTRKKAIDEACMLESEVLRDNLEHISQGKAQLPSQSGTDASTHTQERGKKGKSKSSKSQISSTSSRTSNKIAEGLQQVMRVVVSTQTDINSKFESMQSNMGSKFESMQSKVSSMQTNVSSRFDGINKKFDSKFEHIHSDMKNKLEQMQNKFEGIINDINSKFDVMAHSLQSVQGEMNNLQDDVQTKFDKVNDNLHHKIQHMNLKVDIVKSDISRFYSEMKGEMKQEINQTIDRVNTLVGSVQSKIEEVVDSQIDLQRKFKEIDNRLDKLSEHTQVKKMTTFSNVFSNTSAKSKTQETHYAPNKTIVTVQSDKALQLNTHYPQQNGNSKSIDSEHLQSNPFYLGDRPLKAENVHNNSFQETDIKQFAFPTQNLAQTFDQNLHAQPDFIQSEPTHSHGTHDFPSTNHNPPMDPTAFAQAMGKIMRQSRITPPTPMVFKGDPTTYAVWKRSVSHLLEQEISESEKLAYLHQFLSPDLQKEFKAFLQDPNVASSERVMERLDNQYGNPHFHVKVYREELEAWPNIRNRDYESLRLFSNFLIQLDAISQSNSHFRFLDELTTIKMMCDKLPEGLANSWIDAVGDFKCKNGGQYPGFKEFSDFVNRKSSNRNDPFFAGGRTQMQPSSQNKNVKRTASTNATEASISDNESKLTHAVNKMTKTFEKQIQEMTNTFMQGLNQTQSNVKTKCGCCRRYHSIDKCQDFLALKAEERVSKVIESKLCVLCLMPFHLARNCTIETLCRQCKKRHHSLLHHETCVKQLHDSFVDLKKKAEQNRNSERVNDGIEQARNSSLENISENHAHTKATESCTTTMKSTSQRPTTLTTLIVPVLLSSRDNPEDEHLCYAMLDTQSDATYVRTDLVDKTKSQGQPTVLTVSTVTHRGVKVRCQVFQGLQIRGMNSQQRIDLNGVYSRDHLDISPDRIPTKETAESIPHLRYLASSIPERLDIPVGLLIGYDNQEALKIFEVVNGPTNLPYAHLTHFGWAIIGAQPPLECFDTIGNSHFIHSEESSADVVWVYRTEVKETALQDLVQIINREVQDLDDNSLSQDDIRFSNLLKNGICKNELGHFQMPLPFSKDNLRLPDNRFLALRRLMSLKNQFHRKPEYKAHYKAFMREILDRGDAEEVCSGQVQVDNRWYLPHHGVYHPKKPGKLRVVFDCSARHQGQSLNDYLLQGPDLLNSLTGVLCRFRLHDIAFNSDVEKMFHQFHVLPAHRDYLRFLWWRDGDSSTEPVDFRMKVHLFGATSSPGCANFGLKYIADQFSHIDQSAANFLKDDFYVDDGLKSETTVEKAFNTLSKAREICSRGNLRLHKISSNSEELLSRFPASELSTSKQTDLSAPDNKGSVERTLGIQWCTTDDCFKFSFEGKRQPHTRRGLLSVIASLYDPLGFLSPFILKGKQVLQQTCVENLDWDEPINDQLSMIWDRWLTDLKQLQNITIPRCYTPKGFPTPVVREVHHFSDASEIGFGSCSYLRTVGQDHSVHCSLIMSKSRVAPKKKVTIPRLELLAAVLSAKTGKFLQKELGIPIEHHFFWTDSKVVLGYIQNSSRRFHVFVANRVQKICDGSQPNQWSYVETKQNPADHASRGMSIDALVASNWFNGPSFLWDRQVVRKAELFPVGDDDKEVKDKVITCSTSAKPTAYPSMEQLIARMSSLSKLQAVFGRILAMFRKRSKPPVSILESRELAMTAVVRQIQHEYFSRPSPQVLNQLRQLDVKRNEDNVMIVGGRIENSSHSRKVTNPIVLPKDSHLSVLVARKAHERMKHLGRTSTIHEIRSLGYWIIGMRRVVDKEIRTCRSCTRQRGACLSQKMSDLPEDRLERTAPFTYCGIDCFGPFYTRVNRSDIKRYVLLVTCLASRAIHTEMLEDMSTNAFINALRRVISVRGNIRLIRSDRGTNFVGADRELREAFNEMVNEDALRTLLNFNCEFRFNTPTASHMGGVWERQIRSVRSALFSMLQDQKKPMTDMEFQTLLHEATAVVNSRPLTLDSLETSDSLPLSPNHLLTMKHEPILPLPGKFSPADIYTQRRWRTVQFFADQFWSKWVKDYLSNIQKRQKWTKEKRNVQEGDIVWLSTEMNMRSSWPMARVVATFPDKDGFVRKVRVQVVNRDLSRRGVARSPPQVFERPIHKLVLFLPVEDQ